MSSLKAENARLKERVKELEDLLDDRTETLKGLAELYRELRAETDKLLAKYAEAVGR